MMRKERFLSKSTMVGDNTQSLTMNKENKKKCQAMLKTMKADGNSEEFRKPVDYVGLNLSDYPKIIKKPMDLSTVSKKLRENKYSSLKEFFDDLKLIWDNCKTFNMEDSDIYVSAIRMEELTKKLINENFEVFYKNDSLTSSNLISENNFIPSIFNFMQNPLIEENKNTLPSETTSQQQNCIFSEEDIHAPLTIKDKIMLAETFKNLNPEIICTAVNLINQINPIAIEDKDDEKLYIRVDLLNRVVFEKLLKLFNERHNDISTKDKFK